MDIDSRSARPQSASSLLLSCAATLWKRAPPPTLRSRRTDFFGGGWGGRPARRPVWVAVAWPASCDLPLPCSRGSMTHRTTPPASAICEMRLSGGACDAPAAVGSCSRTWESDGAPPSCPDRTPRSSRKRASAGTEAREEAGSSVATLRGAPPGYPTYSMLTNLGGSPPWPGAPATGSPHPLTGANWLRPAGGMPCRAPSSPSLPEPSRIMESKPRGLRGAGAAAHQGTARE
eukprot:scaffold13462_cov87-Isochrysis_galbana.AAC.3